MESDFEHRVIKDDGKNIDIYVDLDYRSVNIVDNKMSFFNSRIQFPRVKAMIIRITSENEIATVHLLRDIDLLSAFANFEIDYKRNVFKIMKNNEYVLLEKTDL